MGERKPKEELYALAEDPQCVNNLADDPSYREVRRELASKVAQLTRAMGDLGEVSERELIRRGLVANRLDDDYRRLVKPLPAEDAIGPLPAPLEMKEAEAWRAGGDKGR